MKIKRASDAMYSRAAEAYTEEATDRPPPLGMLRVRKIITEEIPVVQGPGGHLTIGQMIDEHLRDTVLGGGDILEVSWGIDPADGDGVQAVRDMYK